MSHPARLDRTSVFGLSSRAHALLAPLEHALGLRRLAEVYARLPEAAPLDVFVARALEELGVEVEVEPTDRERLPQHGPLVVVANHPFGGVEGLALGQLLLGRRTDVKILANHLLGRITELRDLFIFIDPFGGPESVRRNLAGLRHARRHLEQGGALVVFPAGEVASLDLKRRRVEDPAWLETAASLIRRSRATVVPAHIPGRNGALFLLAGLLHPRMRTLLLGRALVARMGRPLEIRLGSPISHRQLAAHSTDETLTAYLRQRTQILGERAHRVAVQPRRTPVETQPIAPGAGSAVLAREVERLPADRLLVDLGEEAVYYAKAQEIPDLLREIGRAREITFREVGEGTGREIDLDRFDQSYLHLFAWNRKARELIGAYRIGQTDKLVAAEGLDGLYTSTLFDFKPHLFESMGPALEMGRSFIRAEYQKSYAGLMLLWKGIGQFVLRDPRYKTLFGPVSISADYRSASQRLILAFLEENRYVHEWSRWVRPRTPLRVGRAAPAANLAHLRDLDEVSTFISEIEGDHKGVPILLRQYLKLGGRLLGFNVDTDFSNVLDVLIMVDLRQTEPRILARYMGAEETARFQLGEQPDAAWSAS